MNQATEMKDIFVKVKTNLGTFKIQLFASKVPRTVSNFYQLGTEGFYNGVIFHRVIKNFMVQGGDPTGTGMGGPNFRFKDEFHPQLKHDKPGILSMANAGPNTNGSQFFITTVPTPHLDGRHSVFGQVVEGYDVVEKISLAKTGLNDKPLEKIMMEALDFEGDFTPVEIGKL